MQIVFISAGSYTNGLSIVKALESMGIQSKIPACGIIIVCEADQLKTVKSACQLFNAAIEIITEN